MGFNLDDPNRRIVGKCNNCGEPSEIYTNCGNLSCHKHFICCDECTDDDEKKYCKECKASLLRPSSKDIRIVIVREIGQIDFESLCKNLPPSEGHQEFEYTKLKRYVQNRNNLFVAGYFKDELAGVLFGQQIESLDCRKEFFISEIGVSERFRKLGIGHAMLEKTLSYLKSHMFSQCWVLTESDNKAAKALYLKSGGTNFKDSPIGFEWNFNDPQN